MDACFKTFDKDEDNSLNVNEFTALLKALFRNEKGKPYPVDQYLSNELFMIFNQSGDGSMSKQEFAFCWNQWIKKIVRPVSALVVVDVQNDFISGSLSISRCPAAHNGEEVVAPINKLIESVPFNLTAYSLDWHPSDHLSFVDNVGKRKLHESSPIQDPSKAKEMDKVVFEGPPMTEQILWPRHCVQNSWGAELHKDLKVVPDGVMIHKGYKSNIDSYSAFFDNKKLGHTEMESVLKAHGITDCFVCGIAYDVCVGDNFGALDLIHVTCSDHYIHCSLLFWHNLHTRTGAPLQVPPGSLIVRKGDRSFTESYSAFLERDPKEIDSLSRSLRVAHVTDVFVCGIAYDVCVGATALHAQELGFRTILIDDCSRGIRMDDIKSTIQKIKDNHGLIVQSSEVKALVQGRDRRIELGYQWALECRKNIVYPPKNKNSKYNQQQQQQELQYPNEKQELQHQVQSSVNA